MITPRLLLLVLITGACARADVTLAPPFRPHAVLQRDQRLPVWGRAEPGEAVRVQLGEREAQTVADPAGRWRVDLEPIGATREPLELVVRGRNTVVVPDILVGDVWLLSGQSNMEWPVRLSRDADAEIAAADFPRIRHFKTERTLARDPAGTVNGAWAAASPATAGHFSAVGFFFARELMRELDVPIGLINSTWGGTPVEAWLPPSELEAYPVRRMAAAHHALTLNRIVRQHAAHEAALAEWASRGATPPAPSAPWTPGPEIAPGVLYNGMIAPLVPVAVRGVLWYQGESNTDQPETYQPMFTALIESWREHFEQPDLPFYWVQLANFAGGDAAGTGWARLRDAQTATLALPHTGQAVTIDIGEPDDIHPRNKQDVGRRLARLALAQVYGREVADRGPTVAAVRRDGAAMRVRFKHAEGLHASDGGSVAGFEVAGADEIFHDAVATIDGSTVVVQSPEVPEPVAVRYAWRNAPAATLRNRAGLPAVPFRSDDW